MTDRIPAHRSAVNSRSGDTLVIGAGGTARNVDEEARAAAAREAPAAAPLPDPITPVADAPGDAPKPAIARGKN